MQASVARVAERVDRALHLHPVGREGRYRSTCKSEFKVSWREASPPNHHADKVVSDQWVVSKEFSLYGGRRQWHASLNAWIVRYIDIPLGGKVGIRLPENVMSKSHGARPVHLTITISKWIRAGRLIKNSLSGSRRQWHASLNAWIVRYIVGGSE